MELKTPACNRPDCVVTLGTRPATGRRGDRTVVYEARFWRCEQCGDPDTGEPPFEFLDSQLMKANDAALAAAWRKTTVSMQVEVRGVDRSSCGK